MVKRLRGQPRQANNVSQNVQLRIALGRFGVPSLTATRQRFRDLYPLDDDHLTDDMIVYNIANQHNGIRYHSAGIDMADYDSEDSSLERNVPEFLTLDYFN